MTQQFARYRPWFYAAAVYNTVGGSGVLAFPGAAAGRGHRQTHRRSPFVRVTAMMVGVYAYGYYLLAREPRGTAASSGSPWPERPSAPRIRLLRLAGALPWSFAWMCVSNDVIWWPAFWGFALTHARKTL